MHQGQVPYLPFSANSMFDTIVCLCYNKNEQKQRRVLALLSGFCKNITRIGVDYMATIAKGHRQVRAAYICSKCRDQRILTLDLYAEATANAFFHERDMAEEAREKAFEQAMKDMVLCYEMPRMLGSYTDVPTDSNRVTSYYRFIGMDTPCKCGNVEPWQKAKKSLWNPVDVPFQNREPYPDIPAESRPYLVDSAEALAAWLANPMNPPHIAESGSRASVSAKERAENLDTDLWVCNKCKTMNKMRVHICQGCGVTKQWSDALVAKKKSK